MLQDGMLNALPFPQPARQDTVLAFPVKVSRHAVRGPALPLCTSLCIPQPLPMHVGGSDSVHSSIKTLTVDAPLSAMPAGASSFLEHKYWFGMLSAIGLVTSFSSTLMFTALGSFFNRVSDPGG